MNFPFSFHWSVPLFLSSFVEIIVTHLHLFVNTFLSFFYFIKYCQFICICIELYPCKSDIRNPLSLFAHERSRFAYSAFIFHFIDLLFPFPLQAHEYALKPPVIPDFFHSVPDSSHPIPDSSHPILDSSHLISDL